MTLMLHAGAKPVTYDELRAVQTPEATDTHLPVPHHEIVQLVRFTLGFHGHEIAEEHHGVTEDGSRYFGLMTLRSPYGEYTDTLGLRNSHDKTFPAGIVAGASVFVCDNLSFSGEVKFARKHTRNINRDLPQLVERSIGLLLAKWNDQDKRINAYKETEVEESQAHDLIIRACDVGVCSNRLIPAVLHEWREPRHEDFEPRTVWSFFNAMTEVLKGNLVELPKRTERLHALLDLPQRTAPLRR